MKKNNGFTLIEIVIALAILGLLMAVALPSWQSFMIKTKRTEAKVLLTEVANEQVRYFTENNRYAKSMTQLGYGSDRYLTENGNYSVRVATSTASTFSLVAIPEAGTSQVNDKECLRFTLNSSGVKGVTGTAVAEDCW